eukprot:snap_masked-scaffold_19-processed-gene-5.23-mRNA-1 protein AED:0.01 eAED:0.01 QI:0/-1/0/1/-1/1/1/0/595
MPLDSILYDLKVVPRLLKLLKSLNMLRKKGYVVTDFWYRAYNMNPSKACLIQGDKTYTYQDVEDLSNQWANFLLTKNIEKGSVISLLYSNSPLFVIIWLGITKAGYKVALLNTAVKRKGLIHCLKIVDTKLLVYDPELSQQVDDIIEEIPDIELYKENFNIDLENISKEKIDKKHRENQTVSTPFGYIYTSGTTGLPKAAIVMHVKMIGFGMTLHYMFKIQQKDIIYTCLPLFHSSGGGLAIGVMLYLGGTVAIGKKFSAKNFFEECTKYNATVTQYIGEICRYLLSTPKGEFDKKHKIRIAVGNGLRPEIWDKFQDRFNIREIGEFYGSTEGNSATINYCTKKRDRGFCGRYGPILTKLAGIKIVKFDIVEEKPVRGEDGFCIDCKKGEVGEMLFIINPKQAKSTFHGYENNKEATEKKIIENVFKTGDKYFRTGDLMVQDKYGYFKFIDRIGDTFRWKGENCSTTEVTEIIGNIKGIEEVNVYGIQIPNNLDGRAPTAGIIPVDGDMDNVDLKKLSEVLFEQLPSYAIPIFIRVLPEMEITATMKHQKVQLRNEGIDLTKIKDKMYWLNPESKMYESFGQAEYEAVVQGEVKI